jgi:hypothetical protein
MEKIYWDYAHDGEERGLECESREDAHAKANAWFEERVLNYNAPRNGEEFEEDIEILEFYIDDACERVIVNRWPDTVYYEHYHGDAAEHGTWYAGGSL